jgi:hypothetical protein
MTVFDTSRTETTYSLGNVASADIPDERLRDLVAYWHEQRGSNPLPGRDDVDPLDLPHKLLPNMILLDIVGSERYRRFRFRLVGTAIYTHVGRELTGLHIDEALPEPYLSYVSFTHATAADRRCPVYSETLYHDQGNFVNGASPTGWCCHWPATTKQRTASWSASSGCGAATKAAGRATGAPCNRSPSWWISAKRTGAFPPAPAAT